MATLQEVLKDVQGIGRAEQMRLASFLEQNKLRGARAMEKLITGPGGVVTGASLAAIELQDDLSESGKKMINEITDLMKESAGKNASETRDILTKMRVINETLDKSTSEESKKIKELMKPGLRAMEQQGSLGNVFKDVIRGRVAGFGQRMVGKVPLVGGVLSEVMQKSRQRKQLASEQKMKIGGFAGDSVSETLERIEENTKITASAEKRAKKKKARGKSKSEEREDALEDSEEDIAEAGAAGAVAFLTGAGGAGGGGIVGDIVGGGIGASIAGMGGKALGFLAGATGLKALGGVVGGLFTGGAAAGTVAAIGGVVLPIAAAAGLGLMMAHAIDEATERKSKKHEEDLNLGGTIRHRKTMVAGTKEQAFIQESSGKVFTESEAKAEAAKAGLSVEDAGFRAQTHTVNKQTGEVSTGRKTIDRGEEEKRIQNLQQEKMKRAKGELGPDERLKSAMIILMNNLAREERQIFSSVKQLAMMDAKARSGEFLKLNPDQQKAHKDAHEKARKTYGAAQSRIRNILSGEAGAGLNHRAMTEEAKNAIFSVYGYNPRRPRRGIGIPGWHAQYMNLERDKPGSMSKMHRISSFDPTSVLPKWDEIPTGRVETWKDKAEGFSEGGLGKFGTHGRLAMFHGDELVIPMNKILSENSTLLPDHVKHFLSMMTGNSLVKNTPQGGGGMGTNIIAPTTVSANNKTENNTFTEGGIRNNDLTLREANRRVYS